MKEKIQQLVRTALSELSPAEAPEILAKIEVEVAFAKPGFGDYTTNIAMMAFKQFNQLLAQSPTELALALIEKIKNLDEAKLFSDIEVKGGFINFKLSVNELSYQLEKIIELEENYGSNNLGKEQKVLVEYFQPNIAKPLHLGHLRTAIIGDALFRILEFAGFKVESDTHLGDWGTQFGLLMLAYKKWGDINVIEQDPIVELNKLYVRINSEIETELDLREQGKQEFVKLEQGDQENTELWQKFKDWSWQEYKIIYDDLEIRRSDHDWPESFYSDKMPQVLQRLRDKGLLMESQGAQIVNLEDHNLGVAVLVKSDGGTTYLLRDLATYIYRKQQGFEKQIYVVDNRQAHTLAQTFKILELLGDITVADEAVHIAYGVLVLPEGQMSTRKGTIVGAKELISKAQDKALEIIEQKNPDLKNKPEVAKQVMQAALKYFDLSHNYKSDIVFTWDKALSFEGNTGPYLQYTHARINGILRKSGIEEVSKELDFSIPEAILEHESLLLRKIYQFPEIIEQVCTTLSPNLLTNYLFELSQDLNRFYEAVPILGEQDIKLRNFRLSLILGTAIILRNGLKLLGISAPKEM